MTRPMRWILFLLPALLLGCGDGPVGLVDAEKGVRAEVTPEGIVVENQKAVTIHAVAYGEYAMLYQDLRRQTLDRPGRAIAPGETRVLRFGSRVRPTDAVYSVRWLTSEGRGDDRTIAERGALELAR